MPISALAGLVFGIAVVSIGVYHVTFVAPRIRALERRHVDSSQSADGNLSGAQPGAPARGGDTAITADVRERLERLEATYKQDACRIGFVRYNAFENVGSDQSFTLALLNDSGDGVVVTSIHSRDDTRTYGKAVRNFTPQQGASKEEQSAIAMARTGVGV